MALENSLHAWGGRLLSIFQKDSSFSFWLYAQQNIMRRFPETILTVCMSPCDQSPRKWFEQRVIQEQCTKFPNELEQLIRNFWFRNNYCGRVPSHKKLAKSFLTSPLSVLQKIDFLLLCRAELLKKTCPVAKPRSFDDT